MEFAGNHTAIGVFQVEADGEYFGFTLRQIFILAVGEGDRPLLQIDIGGHDPVGIVGVGGDIRHDDTVTVDVLDTGQKIDPKRLALTQ